MKRVAAAVAAILGAAAIIGVVWCFVGSLLYLGAYGDYGSDDWDL